MENKVYIKKNWGLKPIPEMIETLDINLTVFLEIAFELQLYKENTPNIRRTWTTEEEEFLINHAEYLSVRKASNLLYRSYYATYQTVRMLGLGNLMINKK